MIVSVPVTLLNKDTRLQQQGPSDSLSPLSFKQFLGLSRIKKSFKVCLLLFHSCLMNKFSWSKWFLIVRLFMIQLLCLIYFGFQTFDSVLLSIFFHRKVSFPLGGELFKGSFNLNCLAEGGEARRNRWKGFWWSASFYAPAAAGTLEHLAQNTWANGLLINTREHDDRSAYLWVHILEDMDIKICCIYVKSWQGLDWPNIWELGREPLHSRPLLHWNDLTKWITWMKEEKANFKGLFDSW